MAVTPKMRGAILSELLALLAELPKLAPLVLELLRGVRNAPNPEAELLRLTRGVAAKRGIRELLRRALG